MIYHFVLIVSYKEVLSIAKGEWKKRYATEALSAVLYRGERKVDVKNIFKSAPYMTHL